MSKIPCLAVFGGSGKTGRELIAVALKKGLLVRALYRPGSEPGQTPGLEIIIGQLTERGDIRRTRGHRRRHPRIRSAVGAACPSGTVLCRCDVKGDCRDEAARDWAPHLSDGGDGGREHSELVEGGPEVRGPLPAAVSLDRRGPRCPGGCR